MSENVLIEVAKQVPWAVIVFAVIFVFLKRMSESEAARLAHEKELEAQRIAAAKDRATSEREHQASVNNLWAQNIKSITERWEQTSKQIADALSEHERASQERYNKMNITQDLLEAAKENLRRSK